MKINDTGVAQRDHLRLDVPAGRDGRAGSAHDVADIAERVVRHGTERSTKDHRPVTVARRAQDEITRGSS
jgi:hypothetical protein